MALLQRVKTFFTGREPAPDLSLEELRAAFRSKYYAFKLLLAANNTALQLMTDMEAALHGQQSFGMTFVRSHCTAVCVNVFSLIRHLNELAGQKYQALEPVFESLREKIEAVLQCRQPPAVTELVLPLSRVSREMADGVGSKMANLGEISNRLPELLVPQGLAITAAAYELFLTHNGLRDEINRRLQSLEGREISDLYRLSSEIQMLIIAAEIPPELAEAVDRAYRELEAACGPHLRVALRSSAIGEDAVDTSFAGQYRSELNVSRENLFTVYKEILASKYALTAVSYRLHKGLRDEDVAMCVGCMRMVDSVAGGVMYSRDPTDIRRDTVFINAVHGLAKTVVDGSVTPDLWVISRGEPPAVLRREIRDKKQKAVCRPGEGVSLEADEAGLAPVLTEAQALELARLALRLEEHFGSPQDIEWCRDEAGRFLILQSRPLKQLAAPVRETAAVSFLEHPVLLQGGETASSGVAAGKVFVARNQMDLLQFPAGAVLVTTLAHPSWATLLSRAAAVVTDRGGITGHLANVAREFGIPALLNTGRATELLPPGTLVTVDADGQAVYQGRVESLLNAAAAVPRGLMQGTPVYETLKEAMAFITPLNLTNPEASEFKPRGCRTLHDITRFAHEVSVKEMFAFDKHRALTQYFIKRLVTDLPLQWWVLDLEDGFKEEVPGKEVTLDQIASIPMLALWQGIGAVPWAGPPPVDTRGMFSIIMGAATSPNLDTAGGTIYGNQNYFMISRSFCNLTSRLGFHFSTVEALAGEEPFENYVRFVFKGGAADYPRRVLRAQLVGEILEKYHFQVEVKEDSLFARLEGEPQDYMLSRLRLLGYLTIHTRQIDMVMLNAQEAQFYREKFIQDIEQLLLM